VIVDEVHERDINSDFLLILLREIVRAGVGIKVILMSASVDAQLYVKYFMDRRAGITEVPCVNVEGHCYPVTEMYLDKICNLIGWRGMTTEDQGLPGTDSELVTSLLVYLTRTQPEGAILVFLPGWDDIMSVIDLLNHRFRNESQRYLTLPLHSMLSSRDQQSVFNVPPPGVRKIILATNIAESSVTIDDIVYVVNTGTVKVKMFDPTKKITHLSTEWSSKASVIQRRGRAGRCQPGHAYNLFTKEQFASMDDYQVPEMQRTPLEDLVLQAKLLNPCHKVANFLSQALDPPRASAISSAVDVLKDLGALDDSEGLTPMGTVLAELPIEPVIGRLVLLGAVLGTLDPILTIAASMGHRDPFVNPPTKRQQADAVER
jgi:HrpA-like RNA helicase